MSSRVVCISFTLRLLLSASQGRECALISVLADEVKFSVTQKVGSAAHARSEPPAQRRRMDVPTPRA